MNLAVYVLQFRRQKTERCLEVFVFFFVGTALTVVTRFNSQLLEM